jgi:hypothetical protein
MTTTTVSTVAQLNAAIASAATVTTAGTITISLSGNIALGTTALEAINLHSGVVLDIEGNGHTLDGGKSERGLFVYGGTVDVANLALNNMLAQGGNGASGGGGGAGLGGGLFIGSNVAGDAGYVTLTSVTFSGDAARGGNGSVPVPVYGYYYANGGEQYGVIAMRRGGGGGMGGNASGNGGGGIGPGASGSGAGIVAGAAGGGSGSNSARAGASGGGGGAGSLGGGGGVGGHAAVIFSQSKYYGTAASGGAGGWGGGGGGAGTWTGAGGNGGFGGGGGYGYTDGSFAYTSGGYAYTAGGNIWYGVITAHSGIGGWGGGGGAGSGKNWFGYAGLGGGAGFQSGGGGGLGAGGDIFVQAGASLVLAGSGSVSAGTVTGGASGGNVASSSADAAQAWGNGIYLQGAGNALTFAPQGVQTVAGVIADDAGSVPDPLHYDAIQGLSWYTTYSSVGVVVNGAGTLLLQAVNHYTGGTKIQAGTLEIASGASAGSGAITFAGAGTLRIDGSISGAATFANTVTAFAPNTTIDLPGMKFAAGAHAGLSGSTLTVTSGADSELLTLASPSSGVTGYVVVADGSGGSAVVRWRPWPPPSPR